jgi:hypothetical protein
MARRTAMLIFLEFLCSCSFLVPPVYAQEEMRELQSYALPCEPQSTAMAADGSTAWIACEEVGTGELKSDWLYRNWIYALDLRSGRARKISEGHGVVRFLPSPRDSEAIMMRWGEKQAKRALLVNGHGVVKELPIESAIDWSPDGAKVYFEAGSTIEAEAWNILGILSVKDRTMQRVKLTVAAEGLSVCASTGELYFGDPDIDETGNLTADAMEYDPNGKQKAKVEAFPPGTFSAKCRFVATGESSHGPMPWEIVETATGKRLAWFDADDSASAPWTSFFAWNPRRESLYLRTTDTPVKGSDSKMRTVLQAVDAIDGRVLAEFPEFGGAAAWSADGESVMIVTGKKLRRCLLTRGNQCSAAQASHEQ